MTAQKQDGPDEPSEPPRTDTSDSESTAPEQLPPLAEYPFEDGCVKDARRRCRAALAGGLSPAVFDWSATPEARAANSAAVVQWEDQQRAKRKRHNTRRLRSINDQRKRAYALGALAGPDGAGPKLSATPTGAREDTINTEALKMGRYVNSGHLDADEVVDVLSRAAYECRWAQDDCGSDDVKLRDKIMRAVNDQTEQPKWDEIDWHTAEPGSGVPAENWKAPVSESSEDEVTTPVYADRLLTRSDLRSLPEPEPLIDNVLDKGTLAYLYGRWGTLKTFVALDWALCVATGKDWQGRKASQCRVLYVVGEGAFGFKGRVQAWETGWRTAVADDQLHILPVAINFSNPRDVDNLCALVALGGYGFVIIDTLSRCMVGADENSAKDCGVVVDAMTRVLACTPGGRGVVLGVHHAGKDGKTFRGSSVFEAAADTVYFSGRDDDAATVTLKREKRKDGPEHDARQLAFDPIPGTGSGVLKLSHEAWDSLGTSTPTAKLRSIWFQHFGTTGATAAQLREVAVDNGSMAKTSFYRALSELVKSGYLINTGTDKRPFYMTKEQ